MSTVLWFITGIFIGRLLFGNRHAESDKKGADNEGEVGKRT